MCFAQSYQISSRSNHPGAAIMSYRYSRWRPYRRNRPDGCSLIAWCSGKSFTWDVTAACTVADFYLQASYREPHSDSELSATRKVAKYSLLTGSHIFQPLALESHGAQNASAMSFIKELGHKISQRSGDDRQTQFLFQLLSVIMQRYNAVLYGESILAGSDDPDM